MVRFLPAFAQLRHFGRLVAFGSPFLHALQEVLAEQAGSWIALVRKDLRWVAGVMVSKRAFPDVDEDWPALVELVAAQPRRWRATIAYAKRSLAAQSSLIAEGDRWHKDIHATCDALGIPPLADPLPMHLVHRVEADAEGALSCWCGFVASTRRALWIYNAHIHHRRFVGNHSIQRASCWRTCVR